MARAVAGKKGKKTSRPRPHRRLRPGPLRVRARDETHGLHNAMPRAQRPLPYDAPLTLRRATIRTGASSRGHCPRVPASDAAASSDYAPCATCQSALHVGRPATGRQTPLGAATSSRTSLKSAEEDEPPPTTRAALAARRHPTAAPSRDAFDCSRAALNDAVTLSMHG